MAVVALDTYEVVKALRQAGFDEAQAAALTDAVKRAQQIDLSDLATKSDLNELRIATKSDIDELRIATRSNITELRTATKSDLNELRTAMKGDISEVRRELAELKADFLNKLLTVFGLQIVAILGGVAGLLRLLQS